VIEMFEEATYNEIIEDYCPGCGKETKFEYSYNLYFFPYQETVIKGIKVCLECEYEEEID